MALGTAEDRKITKDVDNKNGFRKIRKEVEVGYKQVLEMFISIFHIVSNKFTRYIIFLFRRSSFF
jgi:hypothetical protein